MMIQIKTEVGFGGMNSVVAYSPNGAAIAWCDYLREDGPTAAREWVEERVSEWEAARGPEECGAAMPTATS